MNLQLSIQMGYKFSDLELVNVFLAEGSAICFTILYSRYSLKVYTKCLGYLKDKCLAEDATQEIFLKIYLNLSRFAARSSFSTWIYSITVNHCIDCKRKNEKKEAFSFVEFNERSAVLVEATKENTIKGYEIDQLNNIIECLSLHQKRLLKMKYYHGISIKELSEMYNASESSIKMKLSRARTKCREKAKGALYSDCG